MAPAILALIAPGILLYDRFQRISTTAFVLTWIALLAAMLRTAVAMRDTLLLREVEKAAMTDELTELRTTACSLDTYTSRCTRCSGRAER